MSNPINQKINPYAQPSMGVNNLSLQNPQLQNLQLQNIDTAKIQQGVNESPIGNAANQDSPALMAALLVPTCLGTTWSMNKFNKACRGEYENSLLAKIGNFGDKIGSTKLFQNSIVDRGIKKYGQLKNFLNVKVIEKSSVLRSFFKTPSVPTNHMVLMQAGGTANELSASVASFFQKYTKEGTDLEKVKQLGFVKNGQADVETYNKVVKDTNKYVDELAKACANQPKDFVFRAEKGGKVPFSKKLTGKEIYLSEKFPKLKNLFCPETSFSEFANKFKVLKGAGNTAQKTALGKALPKFSLRVLEGLTNAGTGSGLVAVLMGGFFIADALARSIKAPKDEKGMTFAENIIYNVGWYLMMPFGLATMHKFGGLQYIGMSKDQVEAHRKNVAEFNEKAKAGGFATKEEYKAAKKALKEALKGDTRILKTDAMGVKTAKFMRNLYQRPLKMFGRVLTVGLENYRGYTKVGDSGLKKFFSNFGFKFKDYAGYPVRFGVFMFLIAPFLGKFFAKGSHLVFGRPTHSVLDSEPETPKEGPKDAVKPMTNQPTQPKVVPAAPVAQAQSNLNKTIQMQPVQQNGVANLNQISQNTKRENLLDMYKANASVVKKVSVPQEPVRTYVPSTEGVKLVKTKEQEQKDKEINQLLGKAGKAEANANKYL